MELRTGRISVRFFSRRIGEGCVYDRYFCGAGDRV